MGCSGQGSNLPQDASSDLRQHNWIQFGIMVLSLLAMIVLWMPVTPDGKLSHFAPMHYMYTGMGAAAGANAIYALIRLVRGLKQARGLRH